MEFFSRISILYWIAILWGLALIYDGIYSAWGSYTPFRDFFETIAAEAIYHMRGIGSLIIFSLVADKFAKKSNHQKMLIPIIIGIIAGVSFYTSLTLIGEKIPNVGARIKEMQEISASSDY